MKIYLDNIIFSSQKSGGISVYWKEILVRILKDKLLTVKIIEQNKNNQNIFSKKIKILDENIINEDKLPLWSYKFLPLTIRIPKDSIFHSSYYRVSYSKNIKNIVTVHDFTHEYFFPIHKKLLNYWKKKLALLKADGIICISENTKKDLIKFHPWVKNKKIKVIYNGVGEEFNLIKNIKKENNILFIGSRVSYKNFNLLPETLKNLNKYKLVIIGGGELTKREKEKLDSLIPGRYEQKLGIDSKQLNIELNKAFCLVYPSSYEGFGIPILEAMKAGCPVITTKKSSIPEVAGEAALILEKLDSANLVSKINKLENSDLRKELIQRGIEQSKKFSWSKTYKELIDFYFEIKNDDLTD